MKELKMAENKTQGKLIIFCGLDGCGKSTMAGMLSEWLRDRNKNVFITRQPTEFVRKTDMFRTYMDGPNHEAYDYRSLSLLAASDRLQHSLKVILPELEKGTYVISERYIYSFAANLWASGYRSEKWIYEIIQKIIKPDVAFFLDVPASLAIKRVRERENEKHRYIDMYLQYKLHEEYLKIAGKNGGIIIDSSGDKEKTFEEVIKALIKESKKGGIWL